ncbi:hypothetical protein INS49_003843 [Diaporthe citri]|uniref:uncharacterized protein n=1 Tax=Diaporthe citri TaxID=83186 RepID=UPI001C81A34B|nr:uncharacterized protein INS49_003843 [Diaporthe citri]KAG6354762.1 hypothetical protein INS49_003843 [Diaporthe citri]
MKITSDILRLITAAMGLLATTAHAQNSSTVGPERGSLVVVGGGSLSDSIYQRVIDLAGGSGPASSIVVIPTADGADSHDQDAAGAAAFRRLGAGNVTVLHTYDPAVADTEEFVAPLLAATGVWFGGGRQWRLVDAYAGTRSEAEFRAVLERGGVIGGSSAGASIQGSFLARGDTANNQIMVGDHQVGFGYLKNTAIDQHVLVRNRVFDLFDILKVRPELLAFGIDENTALVVSGNDAEVIGASYVAVYDGGFWSREGSELKNLPDSSSIFYYLRNGDRKHLDTAMPMQFIHVPFASLLACSRASKGQYDGHKVVRVKTDGRPNAVLKRLASISLEPWKEETVGSHFDVVVPPEKLAQFESLKLRSTILHTDLGESIAAESASQSTWKRQADDLSWYDTYHPYKDHIQYFEDLQALFPNNSELISSGTSYEGRDLFGIHLWGDAGPGKPAVLYHGTTVEYLTLQLIHGYKGGDNDTRTVLDSFDFYIVPIVNPDGFVYTQTTERLWRKNRQPGPANSTCVGRDINRNWEFAWNPTSSGASADPCGQTYGGEAPSDSPENKGLDGLVRELRDRVGIKLYIDWHSYGQYFLFPYGYNETIYLPQLGKWSRTGSLMSEEIRDSSDRRTTFTFGPGGAILYRSVGNSRDHVYAIGGADFSWTIELPDTGDFGFVLPPEQIRPTVEEQWAGQKVLYSLLNEVFFDDEGPA